MKKITYLIIALCITSVYGQKIGIGTTKPKAELHIEGDLLVQDEFTMNNITTVTETDEDFKLMTRVTNSTPVGQLKVLDVDNKNVAPVNSVDYSFTNIHLDNLRDVNLQFDTSKYVVGVANFRHVGDAIKKTPVGTTYSIGHFVVRTFESGGTWHLEIRNVDLDLDVGDSIDYYITLIIYDKKYFRHLSPITTDLGGSNTGTASSTPILY